MRPKKAQIHRDIVIYIHVLDIPTSIQILYNIQHSRPNQTKTKNKKNKNHPLTYSLFIIYYFLDTTQTTIPPKTSPIPNHVLAEITFRSTYHSPRTVKRKAIELVMGTVRESSAGKQANKLASAGKLFLAWWWVRGEGCTVLPNQEEKPYTAR